VSAAKCRLMIPVSRNISFVLIFAISQGFPGTPHDSGVLEILDARTFPSKFPTRKPTLLCCNTNDSSFWKYKAYAGIRGVPLGGGVK